MPDSGSRPLPDPFKVWKQWFDVQEESWSSFCQEILTSEAFAAAMGRYLEGLTALQGQARSPLVGKLPGTDGPSRADFDRLTDEVRALRRTVADLERRIARLSAPARDAEPAPAADRRPAPRRPRTTRAKEPTDERTT